MASAAPDSKSRLIAGAGMPAPEQAAFGFGTAVWMTAPAPYKASGADNEDALALLPVAGERGVLVVADGMGGTSRGGEASRLAIRAVARRVAEVGADQPLRPAVLDALEQADAAIKALGVGAGTTIVVAELGSKGVRAYHAGDSHLVVVGQRGRIGLQTVPHSPVGYAVHAGVLDDERAMFHDDRHLISNYLGAAGMRIEISGWAPMQPRDRLLLGSDGLFDNVRLDEVVDTIRCGPLRRCAQRLWTMCRQRMVQGGAAHPSKPDDLGFILFGRGRGPAAAGGR